MGRRVLVIDNFEQLFQLTEPDFGPLYEQLRSLPEFAANSEPLVSAAP